ncbi:VWA domain-containing protein [Fimbriiglobus ruber]|nr:VWA domain-containing protein [Fimbriiglobus ruber]
MPYSVRITSTTPACFIFLLDQSGSMSKVPPNGTGKTLAEGVADAVNRVLRNICLKSVSANRNLKDRFYVGMVRYGQDAGPALAGPLVGKPLVGVSELNAHPLRMVETVDQVKAPTGQLVERRIKWPVWVDPVADGKTPMCAALRLAEGMARMFVNEYPDCYPPIVLNITDGIPNDGDPRPYAKRLCQVASSDGETLLFNLHISAESTGTIQYPAVEDEAWDKFARLLFRMSSPLPETMLAFARQLLLPVTAGSRGFGYNADLSGVVQFLDIGTQTQVGPKP